MFGDMLNTLDQEKSSQYWTSENSLLIFKTSPTRIPMPLQRLQTSQIEREIISRDLAPQELRTPQNHPLEPTSTRPEVPPIYIKQGTSTELSNYHPVISQAPEIPTLPKDVWSISAPTEEEIVLSESRDSSGSDKLLPKSPSPVGSEDESCGKVLQRIDHKTTDLKSYPEVQECIEVGCQWENCSHESEEDEHEK